MAPPPTYFEPPLPPFIWKLRVSTLSLTVLFVSTLRSPSENTITKLCDHSGGINFPCVWKGHEDYRWEVVRSKAPYVFTNPFISTFVNLFFICGWQLFLMSYFSGGVMVMCVAKDQIAGRYTFIVHFVL